METDNAYLPSKSLSVAARKQATLSNILRPPTTKGCAADKTPTIKDLNPRAQENANV